MYMYRLAHDKGLFLQLRENVKKILDIDQLACFADRMSSANPPHKDWPIGIAPSGHL